MRGQSRVVLQEETMPCVPAHEHNYASSKQWTNLHNICTSYGEIQMYNTTSLQYSNNTLCGRIIQIICEKKYSKQGFSRYFFNVLFRYLHQNDLMLQSLQLSNVNECTNFSSGVTPNLPSYTPDRESRGHWNKFASRSAPKTSILFLDIG